MRFAFISDIHGNLHALDRALADLQHKQVDQLVCLGDVASLGPQPREVIARLQQLQIPIVMGNHDQYLLDPDVTASQHPWLRAAELWCEAQFTIADFNFLRSFKPQLNFSLDQKTSLLCFHGSPRSNEEFLFPNTTPEILDEVFKEQTAKIFVGGHTHVQTIRQHRSVTYFNPGSVGTPFEFPAPGSNQRPIRRAEYGIIDLTDDKLSFDLYQLPIDFEYLAQITRASGMPDPDYWLSTWAE